MRSILRAIWNVISAPFRFVIWLIKATWGVVRRITLNSIEFFAKQPDENRPIVESFQTAVENPKDILVHLDALRRHLLRSVLVLIAASGLAFIYSSQILNWLAAPIEGGMDALQAIEVTEPIGVVMRVSLVMGFAIALPYISLEGLFFVSSSLTRRERAAGCLAIPFTVIFFVAGALFAYHFMLPPALGVLLNFGDIQTLLRPSSYIRFTTGIMFWIGLFFEFPLLTYVLTSIGIIRAQTLRNNWRLAVVIMAVIAAAITPTVDPINMMLVLGPLVVLYFVSIGLAYIAQGRRAARRKAS